MPPFKAFPIVKGIKEKVGSLILIEDKLYVASGNGNLSTYFFTPVQIHQNASSSASRPSSPGNSKTISSKGKERERAEVRASKLKAKDTSSNQQDVDRSYAEEGLAPPLVKLQTSKKGLSRKAIDQMGWVPATNELVTLSDGVVTLFDLPNLKAPTVVTQAKYAQTFAIQTWLIPSSAQEIASNTEDPDETRGTWITTLVIGCRRKVVVMTWCDSRPEPTRELNLPHTPRLLLFSNSSRGDTVHLCCSATETYILAIPRPGAKSQSLSYKEAPSVTATSSSGGGLPASGDATTQTGTSTKVAGGSDSRTGATSSAANQTTAGGSGGIGGALTGLGGYVGRGLGALGGRGGSSVLVGATLGNGEVLMVKDGQSHLVGEDGSLVRPDAIDWDGPPEDMVFIDPYLINVMPMDSAKKGTDERSHSSVHAHGLEIRLATNTAVVQKIIPELPISPDSPAAATNRKTIPLQLALLTQSPTRRETCWMQYPACFVTVPTERVALQSEGSTIWSVAQKPWTLQIEDFAREGRFTEGQDLLESLPSHTGLNKNEKKQLFQRLEGLQMFAEQKWDPALDAFIDLNVTPAKIIALYPSETVSGRLHKHISTWVSLFGGPEGGKITSQPKAIRGRDRQAAAKVAMVGGPSKKLGSDLLQNDAASIRSGKSANSKEVDDVDPFETNVYPAAAYEGFARYLSDRRQKLAAAMANLASPLPDSHSLPPLKELAPEQLFDIPSVPLEDLDPALLLRVAQLVYTALLKVYLLIRPVLVGSLCRIENWCEVEEVEDLLREKGRFSDLVDLYQGKKMHRKALQLLRELAADETDKLDKYPPTIRYLQRLGPSHLETIFEQSKWILNEDLSKGLEIYTADEPEVDALPRKEVADFLEKQSPDACIGYLEHIIFQLGEQGPDFHDRLAELYLKRGTDGETDGAADKLLDFLKESEQYRPERLLGKLNKEEHPRARAVLLGRLGNHEAALQIYVHRLASFVEAEEYCSKVYGIQPDPHGIYLSLLKIYLQPPPASNGKVRQPLLTQALNLIARSGPRLDGAEALDLLPAVVSLKDVQEFIVKNMREGHAKRNQHRIVTSLLKSRKEQVERTAMELQQRRVRITDARICPQCHKRIGQSVIAVHAPRGEVTHYQCKDAFSRRLALARG